MPNTGVAAPGYPGTALYDPQTGVSLAASFNAAIAGVNLTIKATPGRVFYVNVTSAYSVANPLLTDGNGGVTVFVIPLAVGSYAVSGVFNSSIFFNLNGATAGAGVVGYS